MEWARHSTTKTAERPFFVSVDSHCSSKWSWSSIKVTFCMPTVNEGGKTPTKKPKTQQCNKPIISTNVECISWQYVTNLNLYLSRNEHPHSTVPYSVCTKSYLRKGELNFLNESNMQQKLQKTEHWMQIDPQGTQKRKWALVNKTDYPWKTYCIVNLD